MTFGLIMWKVQPHQFNDYYKEMRMKNISIIGDSISTYEGYNPLGYAVYYEADIIEENDMSTVQDTWWAQVIQEFGMKLCVNNSYSGSKVTGAGFPSACSDERLSNLHTDACKPDVIMIYMGFNDFGNGVRVKSRMLQKYYLCFESAYQYMLEKLKYFYPSADIICGTLMRSALKGYDEWMFPEQLAGVGIEEYNNAVREVCRKEKVYLADISKMGCRYETLDGSHPTVRGHEIMAHAWIDCLKNLY